MSKKRKDERKEDPFSTFSFKVEVDGLQLYAFREISGIANNTDIFEYQEGGENQYTHKLVGQTTFSNIVFKNGVSTDMDISKWRKKVIDGKIDDAKVDGTIKLVASNKEERVWRFYNAWPCKLEVSPFNKMEDTIAISTLELAVERVEEA